MARGDLLSIPCMWRIVPYRHFGIDIGDGTVVHLATLPHATRAMQVQRVAMAEFLDGKKSEVELVSDALPNDDVVERALGSVGKSYYHLVAGNCEHFARECKSGDAVSHQSDRLIRGLVRAGLAGLVTTSTRVAAQVASAGIPTVLLHRSAGAASLIGEAARHTAYIASRCAKIEHKHAERIGKSVGVSTAAFTGTISAGPIGGATAAVLYLSIDAISQSAFKTFEANNQAAAASVPTSPKSDSE